MWGCGLCRGGLRGGRLRFIGQREVILPLCSHAVGVGSSVVPLNFNPAWGSEVKQQFQHYYTYMNNHVHRASFSDIERSSKE